jgi:hypothetical protein
LQGFALSFLSAFVRNRSRFQRCYATSLSEAG